MASYITRIATVEIPVANLRESVKWYTKTLKIYVEHLSEDEAMLTFHAKGVPGIFLVKTKDQTRLSFTNTQTNIEHSVIDFYTYDLEGFYHQLKEDGVDVGPLNITNGFGGFGFRDPDGNLLGVTNITHLGQE